MYDEYKAKIISQISDILRNTSYIKNYHTEVRRASNIFNNLAKDKLHIIIWINQDVKDADDVTNTLVDSDTFETKIKNLAKQIDLNVSFDIYNV